jgi:hypothetical protein
MQEHLSTSASQPASHVSEFKSRVEERRSPHLKFEFECNLMFRLLSHGSCFAQALDR